MKYDDGRDKRGRWKPGHCPNPKGRPRKESEISDADVGWFKSRIVEATINGEKRHLDRHELLLHVMYEQATKGRSVTMARLLLERFDKVDLVRAQAWDLMQEKREQYLEDYYEHGKFDEKAAKEVLDLNEMLTYGVKPKPKRKSRSKAVAGPAKWRKGPKPQWLLDEEKRWADQEADECANSDPQREPPVAPDEPTQ